MIECRVTVDPGPHSHTATGRANVVKILSDIDPRMLAALVANRLSNQGEREFFLASLRDHDGF